MATQHSLKYQRYINSKQWQSLSRRCIASTGGFCVVCCQKAHKMESHHIGYQNLGREQIGFDIVPTCHRCHRRILHQERFWKSPEWRGKIERFLKQRWQRLKVNYSAKSPIQ